MVKPYPKKQFCIFDYEQNYVLGISSDTELDEVRIENNPLVASLEVSQIQIRKNTKQCKEKEKSYTSPTYYDTVIIQIPMFIHFCKYKHSTRHLHPFTFSSHHFGNPFSANYSDYAYCLISVPHITHYFCHKGDL